MDPDEALRAVIQVGTGRGFVVEAEEGDRLVITAGHCLPNLPPPHPGASLDEITYRDLLGPLGQKCTVWAECRFVDPIADIAVLGPPDNQCLAEQFRAYQELMANAVPLRISDPPENTSAWLLGLDGRWFRCDVEYHDYIWIANANDGIVPGMSGSPIIADDGSVIGIVCTSAAGQDGATATEGGPNPCLVDNLPGWLLRDLRSTELS